MSADQQFSERLLQSQITNENLLSDATSETVRLHELRSLFDVFVPAATENEIVMVAAIQAELHTQQRRLEALFSDGVIDHREYALALNSETAWCMRRCATILGEERAKQLFGVDDFHDVIVIESYKVALSSSPLDVSTDVRRLTDTLIARYLPTLKEQRQVQRAVDKVNPQEWRAIAYHAWDPKANYADLVGAIAAAEEAYHAGSIHASIEHAHAVLSSVSNFSQITDAPLYLAAWAHHIQGRGYEALMDMRRAALFYDCSLAVKMRMQEWLPALPIYATEIKLGGVEVFQSPIEAATRLSRVAESLEANSKQLRANTRFYRNLLEDSRVSLAEAYLAAGNQSSAIKHANTALDLARELDDVVGEIRSLFVLYRASAVPAETTLGRIREVLAVRERLSSHPRIALVLSQLGELQLSLIRRDIEE